MSRYTFKTKDDKVVAYGYDRPMQSYFITVYDPSKEWKESNTDEENDEAELFDPSGSGVEAEYASNKMFIILSNKGEVLSNAQMVEKLTELGCPDQNHIIAIMEDLQF